MFRSNVVMRICTGLAFFVLLGGAASAQDLSGTKTEDQISVATASDGGGSSTGVANPAPVKTESASTSYQPLTYHGITVYGILDAGVAHQTKGAPYSSDAPQTGLEMVIAKNAHQSITHYANNGLSQSVLGIKGNIPVSEGISAIFKLEPGVDPLSLRFTNSLQTLVANNGVPLSNQTSNYDTPRAGRIDNGDAYLGANLKSLGSVTFGRQTSLMVDNVARYDPNGGSYAFSLIGWIGNVSGAGDAEDLRSNNSLKYANQVSTKYGTYRFAGLCQFKGNNAVFAPDGVYGTTTQLDLGADYHRVSVDFIYARTYDAISSSSLSAAQMTTLPVKSLAGTISDNTVYSVMGKYPVSSRAKVYGGYVHMRYANPSTPLSAGITTIGGYELSVLTQNAYTFNKILQVYWSGLKYSLTPRLDLTGAYYGWHQNSYSGNGCADTSSPKCSGNLNVEAVDAVYKLTRHVDAYAGLEWSNVMNGSASGYLATGNLTTMFGGRYKF
jgi:predicted porin